MDQRNQISVGIDLGDRFSDVCVLLAGNVVERFRFRMQLDVLIDAFRHLPACPVALEAGAQSAWVTRTLESLGFEVVVANPRRLGVISTSTRKNDRNDAEMLARLLAADRTLLSPVQLRPLEAQQSLNVLLARHTLVDMRTVLINTVRSRCKTTGVHLKSGDAASFDARQDEIPEGLEMATDGLFRVLESINTEITAYDTQLAETARRDYPVTEQLQQVHGVGPITSLAFVLILGDVRRFSNGRRAAAYVGLAPRQDQSGAIDRQLGITKAGNTYLRTLLVQCAQSILASNGRDCDLRRWGLRLAERGGKNGKRRAVVATARKLATILFALWKRGEPYVPLHNAAATPPPASPHPDAGCSNVPVLDDCGRVLDHQGRKADCSVDHGPNPNVHRAEPGSSKSADRSVGRGAPSTRSVTPVRPRSQLVKRGPPSPSPDGGNDPTRPKTAPRAFEGKDQGTSTPEPSTPRRAPRSGPPQNKIVRSPTTP